MILYQQKTPYNNLTVTENNGIRTLWSPYNVRQTAVYSNDMTRPFLEYAQDTILTLAFTPHAKSALVLGLGGGSIPMMLQRLSPDITIDVVEIDEVMAEVAQKFFNFRTSASVRLIFDEASNYLKQTRTTYDLLIIDTYFGIEMPLALTESECIENLRRIINADGVLTANLTNPYSDRFKRILNEYKRLFEEVCLLYCTRSSNVLLFACPTKVDTQNLVLKGRDLGQLPDVGVRVEELIEKLNFLKDSA